LLRRRSSQHAHKLLLLVTSHAFVAIVALIGCAAPVTYSPASEDDITGSKDDKKSSKDDTNKKSSSDKSKSSSSSGGGDDLFGDDDDDDFGGSSGHGPKPGGGPTTAPTGTSPVGTTVPTSPTTPTTPTTPTGPTTTPTDPAQACYVSCVAPDAMTSAYVRCSLANCKIDDSQCDDACWQQSGCLQNENACFATLDACDQQCPNGF
jgi:hypothetical protein